MSCVSGHICAHKAKLCHEAWGLEGDFTATFNLHRMGIRDFKFCAAGLPAGQISGLNDLSAC